ncbi:MAG: DUF3179 domain-containing (seleno)protein [Pseudomonadota bacterium]
MFYVIKRAAAMAIAVALIGCAPISADTEVSASVVAAFGAPPDVPSGPLPPDLEKAVTKAFKGSVADVTSLPRSSWGPESSAALEQIVAAGDPRVVWLMTDLMRFTFRQAQFKELSDAAGAILGKSWDQQNDWNEIIDHMIAWDIPAFPGYLEFKRNIYVNALPGWERIFVPGEIDWRLVSWGGVPIDARAFDETDIPCNCIPAADNPPTQSAEAATWLDDDAIVFGIVINGEARAYPRRIMEVREMVNDTLGGRDLAIPYCTLCGAAQAYFTDAVPAGVKRPVMRTSGLLIRSNKVMYDITSGSVFDTFLGKAVTGPLLEQGITLPQATVVTSDWGTWKAAHPQTTVLVERLALGRDFDFRSGRDAQGPIFPIGDVDPRLPVQADVVGVIAPSGAPVAFDRGTALLALRAGETVTTQGVQLALDAGGLRATTADQSPLPSHEAFWFAWSQFHPGTALWSGN